ncbi:MAG: glycosyltransferase family 9 protein [Candidatus Kapabacteria bacterium]|nr:glycosyltransferase family 9 protein [Candidatus Kapabacteria bacterium]
MDIKQIKKILIIRYDKIGDMIATLPAIDCLKRLNPALEIDVLCSNQNYEIIRNDDRINHKFLTRNKPLILLKDALKLRKNNYDLIFSFVFYKTTLGGLISNFSGKRKAIKISIQHKDRSKLYSTFFNILVPSEDFIQSKSMLEVLFNMVCYVFGIDFDLKNIRQKLYIDEEAIQRTNKFINSSAKGKFIIINISAGHPIRTWADENFIKLLDYLTKEYKDLIFVIISSPEDYTRALSISSNFSERVYSFNSKSILDVAALISRSQFVISPDTSIIHLASVYSVPVIGLYSRYSTNINNWGPFNIPHKILLTQKKESINTILPETVFFSFKTLFSELSSDKFKEKN